jgi:hypothetical protein
MEDSLHPTITQQSTPWAFATLTNLVARVDEIPQQIIRSIEELQTHIEDDLADYRRLTSERDEQAKAHRAELQKLVDTQHTEKDFNQLAQEKNRLVRDLEECHHQLGDTKQKLDECEKAHAMPGLRVSSAVSQPRRTQQSSTTAQDMATPAHTLARKIDERSPYDPAAGPPKKKFAGIDIVTNAPTATPTRKSTMLDSIMGKVGSAANSLKVGGLMGMSSSTAIPSARLPNPLSVPADLDINSANTIGGASTLPRTRSSASLHGRGHSHPHPDDPVEGLEDRQEQEQLSAQESTDNERRMIEDRDNSRQISDTTTTTEQPRISQGSQMAPPSRTGSTLSGVLADFYNKIDRSRLTDDAVLASYLQKQGDTAGETLERDASRDVARCGTTALNKEAQSLPGGGTEPCSVCVAKNRPCLVIRKVPAVPPFERVSVSQGSRRRSNTPLPRQPPSAYPGVGPDGTGVRWEVTERVVRSGSEDNVETQGTIETSASEQVVASDSQAGGASVGPSTNDPLTSHGGNDLEPLDASPN